MNLLSHQVLARKWRPKNFDQVAGQQVALTALRHALEHQRLHHAYLFSGTRGVGKTTIGRILAKCLSCEQGISPTPCETCANCQQIDQGRFIDLIEIDAASNTKVEDTRELLDNVQYAPTQGRYKIYLIDEVHMLSNHSFNALLKTLEEPPEHVKFLLATTDPQKLPITVLSRCLQFNLPPISVDIIEQQLTHILQAEKINSEQTAIALIAKAANGSLRDALSLLDQAIAFGDGQLHFVTCQDMLGTIDQQTIIALATAILMQDSPQAFNHIHQLLAQGKDAAKVLATLAELFVQLAIYQQHSTSGHRDFNPEILAKLAAITNAQTLQLLYQITITSQRDLPLAPDNKTGLEMAMLRLLAFIPQGSKPYRSSKAKNNTAGSVEPIQKTKQLTKKTVNTPIATPPNIKADDWHTILSQLPATGLLKQMAFHCTLLTQNQHSVELVIDRQHANMVNERNKQQLSQLLSTHFARTIKVNIQTEATAPTEALSPAAHQEAIQKTQQQHAEDSIKNDPHVRFMQAEFDAIIEPNSITPNHKET